MTTTNRALMLVEDNEDDVFLMKRALKGAHVINPLYVVEDGQEAVDYLAGAGKFADRANYPLPAVVFLDLKLPFLSGHDVLAWIRRQKELDVAGRHRAHVIERSERPESMLRARGQLLRGQATDAGTARRTC